MLFKVKKNFTNFKTMQQNTNCTYKIVLISYKFHLQKKESRHCHILHETLLFYNQKQKDEEEETLTHDKDSKTSR